MNFGTWFGVWPGGRWNTPRIGRILMARGHDATDMAIATTFGPCILSGFCVMTDEVAAA